MKPTASGQLLAQLLGDTPPRLVKKLEAQPLLADDWDWHLQEGTCKVITSGGETVSLKVPLHSLEDLKCSCLLAPRCLHRLAVLAVLPAGECEEKLDPIVAEEALELNSAQRAALEKLLEFGSLVVRVGAAACGLVEQAEAQQLAFQCRQCGLYRAAAAATRLLTDLRQLRADSPEFSQENLAQDLSELLEVAVHLRSSGSPQWVGQARRPYQPVGALKLWGLFSEAVVTSSGYAGCVTTLCDRNGKLYTVSDVAPGTSERAQQAYQAGATLPGLSVSHQQLSRQVVLVQAATVSAEGRLGSGQGVSAALAGPSLWSEVEWGQRRGDLWFLEAAVLGVEREALVLSNGLRVIAAGLSLVVDNLRLLGRISEPTLRWIVRIHPRLENTAIGLAVSADLEGGRANLSLDRLLGAHFPNLAARPRELPATANLSLWSGLERRLWRIAQGGRGCALADERACRQWQEHRLSGAARLWRALVEQAQAGRHDLRGHWQPDPSPGFALHWLAAMRYLERGRRAWIEGSLPGC